MRVACQLGTNSTGLRFDESSCRDGQRIKTPSAAGEVVTTGSVINVEGGLLLALWHLRLQGGTDSICFCCIHQHLGLRSALLSQIKVHLAQNLGSFSSIIYPNPSRSLQLEHEGDGYLLILLAALGRPGMTFHLERQRAADAQCR